MNIQSETPTKRRYTVSATCVQHLWVDMEVDAASEAEALAQVKSMAYGGIVDWAEGDCDQYDFWVEGSTETQDEGAMDGDAVVDYLEGEAQHEIDDSDYLEGN